LNEEENSILYILYCYSLQQHIVLAFCNDFDTHYRVFAYFLLRNKILLFPKWCQKPTRLILRYSSVVNMEKGKFTNLKNSYKIKLIATTLIFSQWWSGGKGNLYQRKKIFNGVSGTLRTQLDMFSYNHVECVNPLNKRVSKAESLKGFKQKVATYSIKGFLKINTNHFTINTVHVSFRKFHNIINCSNKLFCLSHNAHWL